jgi:hypothetical protein
MVSSLNGIEGYFNLSLINIMVIFDESFSFHFPNFFFTQKKLKKFQETFFEFFSNVNFSCIYIKKTSEYIFRNFSSEKRNLGVGRERLIFNKFPNAFFDIANIKKSPNNYNIDLIEPNDT